MNKTEKKPKLLRHEPLVRLAKRNGMNVFAAWGVRIGAFIVSLLVCAVIINAITGLNPIEVYKTMFEGAFGNEMKTWFTLRDAAFLLCIAVALAPAFKMKFWNIGAEGQVLVGGIATAFCMRSFPEMNPVLLLIIMFLVSALAGAIWAFVPAFFKAKFNTNETLFTLMMNYVAIQIMQICVKQWESAKGSNSVGVINGSTHAGWFPTVADQKYLLNVLIVIAVTVIMHIYLSYSKHGYEISVVGESENTAKYAGIDVKKVIIRTMLISGAICGIAGYITVAGHNHTVSVNTAGGNGFTAIIVAWLGKFNALVMTVFSLLLTMLTKGSKAIATQYGINDHMSDIVKGIILFFVLGSEFFINYRFIFRKKQKTANAEEDEKS